MELWMPELLRRSGWDHSGGVSVFGGVFRDRVRLGHTERIAGYSLSDSVNAVPAPHGTTRFSDTKRVVDQWRH
jgi:hypothetical protein